MVLINFEFRNASIQVPVGLVEPNACLYMIENYDLNLTGYYLGFVKI